MSKVSCPRTQHNDPGWRLNPELVIQRTGRIIIITPQHPPGEQTKIVALLKRVNISTVVNYSDVNVLFAVFNEQLILISVNAYNFERCK